MHNMPRIVLTPRQRDVAGGVIVGQTNREIARLLNVREQTVKNCSPSPIKSATFAADSNWRCSPCSRTCCRRATTTKMFAHEDALTPPSDS